MGSDNAAEYTKYVTARLAVLHRAAYLLCGGDKDLADDIVQVTITKLYQRWAKISRVESIDPYVHRMLVRTFIDEKRRWSRRVWLLPDNHDVVSAEDGTRTVDDRDVAVAALRTLPPKQRAALVLRFLLDRPIDEVAETLGCSEGTVKSQCSRGLATLRAALMDESNPIRSFSNVQRR